MTTYSTSLKLTLPGDGQQSGTWGQTTNNNLGTLLEQAIVGYVSIDMLNANVTLTTLNGTTDQARNAIIEVTGTNNAQRDIIAPLVKKTYTIKNSTTGGYAVRIIAATGTQVGVVIPNGMITQVYCDGSDFYIQNNGTVGDYEVDGNFGVTGNILAVGSLTANGITSPTGTFSGAITSASPTFTGTVTVPTPSISSDTTVAATTAFVRDILPTGIISLWYGSIASIPTGWYLCDGSNGTPDLRNKFIVAAGNTYAVGATGGSADAVLVSHTHTASVTDPGHSHTVDNYYYNDASPRNSPNSSYKQYQQAGFSTNSAFTGVTVSNSTEGVSGTNANLPPYYALAYIMKA